jgi:hypothetical protein
MDLDNINDETIELITNAVIKKMLWKFRQEEHQLNSPMTVAEILKGYLPFKETQEEFLLAEMARLHTLLALYEGKEEFMKAAIIKRRIEIVENKLNKYGEQDDQADAGPQI